MADAMTRTATRATGGARRAGRGVPTDPAGEAARKAMSEAGRRVLGAVVDRAVSRVDDVADRLDGVAESGGTGLREALTGRPAATRSERRDREVAGKSGTTVRARAGAAFSLVMYRAVALLQLLQRLALQLLEALQRLARRARTAPAEPESAGADEEGADEDAAGEDDEPDEHRAGRAERRGSRTRRRDAQGPGPLRSVPAEHAPRRGRPRADS
jgi:hypothetical protein